MTEAIDLYLADANAEGRKTRLDAGITEINANMGRLAPLRQHWHGEQPAAFLSTEAAASLDQRLNRLCANFPRLAVMALAERIRLAGIVHTPPASRPLVVTDGATPIWDRLQDANIGDLSNVVTVDRLLFGCAYMTVWAAEGRLTLTADTPASMVHAMDPATGDTEYAVRCWTVKADNQAHAVLYESDSITFWRSDASSEVAPGPGWKLTKTMDNPLGVVPVVPFARRLSAADHITGTSSVVDILDLTDAIAKLLADAMVTSEYYARPRRWATGLEIEEDDEGNPVDPFAKGRHLQSEAEGTKFGQFDPARLDAYSDLIATLTQQVGALSGLPPTYLGLHGDQPPSADAVKAIETQLTTRAYTEQVGMTRGWQDVAAMAAAVIGERPVVPAARREYAVAWDSPEIRTQAQAADAAGKLADMGVPLRALLADPLGYSPEEIDAVMGTAATDGSEQ